jgi:hypothetical protein
MPDTSTGWPMAAPDPRRAVTDEHVLIGEILSVAMFLATIGAVLAGFPVAFTLAGVALIFAGLGMATGRVRSVRSSPPSPGATSAP